MFGSLLLHLLKNYGIIIIARMSKGKSLLRKFRKRQISEPKHVMHRCWPKEQNLSGASISQIWKKPQIVREFFVQRLEKKNVVCYNHFQLCALFVSTERMLFHGKSKENESI